MKTAFIPLGLALLAATVLVASGYGARIGAWDYRFGFQVVRWSLYAPSRLPRWLWSSC
jgi:hypothetical protein